MIAAHLPVLQVIVPLAAAPACVLLGGVLAWRLALAASWAALLAAAALLYRVLGEGTVSYALGSWPPPWGIEYRIDVLGAFVLLIVAGSGAAVMSFARRSVEAELAASRRGLFYAAFLLCLAGLLGIAATGDAFNLFVFLEISSLSTYALISLGRDRRALTAAYQYLIMGTIGATFILIGIGLLYGVTGTLNMADLARRLPEVGKTRTVAAAFAFLTVGISLKLALFPLHLWLPNAYAFAPSAVSAFLAATATKVAVYVLLRFFFTVFGTGFSFAVMRLDLILLPLALLGIVVASATAIFQNNVKRLLAYSSVAQIGYMILGISLASATGLAAGIIHLFNHALMKGGLFLALGCVVYRIRSCRLEAMAGLARRMPWTMAAFCVGGLSLIGVPLTAGFVSKWYLVLGALEQGWWPVAALVVLTSLLAVVYVWRVVEAAYFQPLPAASAQVREAPLSLLLPTWAMAGANVYFGIHTALPVQAGLGAARQLLGAGP